MKIVPLNDEILVRVQKPKEETTKNGIILTTAVQEENVFLAEVLAVSEGILLENGEMRPHSVSPGDMVLFNKQSGVEVRLEGESYHLVRALTLLGKVTA